MQHASVFQSVCPFTRLAPCGTESLCYGAARLEAAAASAERTEFQATGAREAPGRGIHAKLKLSASPSVAPKGRSHSSVASLMLAPNTVREQPLLLRWLSDGKFHCFSGGECSRCGD